MKTLKAQISPENAEEFTQSLGQIAGASYRQILLADKMGVPQALGFSSLRDWVEKRIGGYIRYSVEDRRKIVDELLSNGEKSIKIAQVLGQGISTIGTDKSALGKSRKKRFVSRKIYNSVDSPPPPPADHRELTEAEVQAKLQRTADEGFELLVWERVKDKFLPFWFDLLETLEPDEREILPWVIVHRAPLEENHEKA